MSSDDFAILIDNVSKRYELYDTPGDRLKHFIIPKFQRMAGLETKQYFREFWALKNISFQVKKGETIGIIGRNGSGKSTLLQIICGTLAPSSGRVETNGRVAGLLELGSGFNPEFTGRENVYLNAAILGLTKEEIDERYDDIVAFADIADFIDQPIKLYSSGMLVRLAFAVIVHVDADILVIDEALAVGDALFTQKCMRFLRNFMKNGTIIFVSHDTPSIKNLCHRVLWLEKGQALKEGNPRDICDFYLQYTLQGLYGDEVKLNALSNSDAHSVTAQEDKATEQAPVIDYESKASVLDNLAVATGFKSGVAEVVSFSMEKIENKSTSEFEGGERVRVIMRAKAHSTLTSPILGFIVKDHLGQELFGENTIPFTQGRHCLVMAGQEITAEFVFRFPMLQNGQYVVMSSLANGDSYNHIQHHYVHDALVINVYSSKIRFGIVGIPFESVSLKINNEASYRSSE
ncbi:MAG: ABC transporter ATP-binding protein [Nitrospirae bacterium]|nr:ABC transporter ATP-binding protein [Nitrospirota bacterium]